jgi:hypothetical protein
MSKPELGSSFSLAQEHDDFFDFASVWRGRSKTKVPLQVGAGSGEPNRVRRVADQADPDPRTKEVRLGVAGID